MDGFRADYLQRGLTPHLQRLSDCGVHAPYMRATFPTKTFPNHYTIMTVRTLCTRELLRVVLICDCVCDNMTLVMIERVLCQIALKTV